MIVRTNIDERDWPRCIKCDMPVEDFYAIIEDNSLILIAICHKDIEKVEIPDEIWDNTFLFSVNVEFAFASEQLVPVDKPFTTNK